MGDSSLAAESISVGAGRGACRRVLHLVWVNPSPVVFRKILTIRMVL